MKPKKLILLTSEFPYGNGETFLENEISFLSEAFDQVLIYSCARSTETKRDLPSNVECKLFSNQLTKFDKLLSLKGLFSRIYRTEKSNAMELYDLKWGTGIRNTALVSLFIGKRWKKELEREIATNSNFDLIFYSYWCTDSALGLALLQKDHAAIKTVSRAHGWDLYFEATSFNYQPFRGVIATNLSCLFPISEVGKEYMLNNWKVAPKSVQVSRLGTNKTGRKQPKSEKSILVSCSNLVPLKRVELIAEALEFVKGVDLEWFHFGDGPEFSRVEKSANALNNERIQVRLMGRKENGEILSWFDQNAPDLFINVSTTEGIPVSIMEAMSFGTPVYATNVGGTSEIVNEKNGKLLDPNISPAELGALLQEFFNSKEEVGSELRSGAFDTWNDVYNASNNYTAFVKELLK